MADVLTDESVPRHRWLLFAAQLALICSAKKTGPYIVVALGIVLVAAMLWRRGLSWRQRLISARPLALALVGGLVVHIGIHTAAMTVLEASPGSPVEAYSVPVQQMARIVRYHHDDITEQQHQELRRFFKGHDIGERYTPRVSDHVKSVLDPKELASNRSAFIRLWWELVSAHPRTAVGATLEGTQGYWYPGTVYWMVTPWTWPCMVQDHSNAKEVPLESVDPTVAPGLTCDKGPAPEAANGFNQGFKRLPVIGLLFSIGVWVWVAAVLSGALLLTRRREALPAVALLWLSWGTCLISPVHAESRYAYPILLLLTVLTVLTFSRSGTDKPHADELSLPHQ